MSRTRAALCGALVAAAAVAAALGIRTRVPAAAEPATAAVWVFLHPDSAVPRGAAPALPPHVLERRARRGIRPDQTDYPLPSHLVARVRSTGARIRHESRLLRAVSVDATPAQVARIRMLPFVTATRPVAQLEIAAAPAAASAQQLVDSAFYGANFAALRELGIPTAHLLGFTGRGVNIAILDTGFEEQHESVSTLRVVARRDFINGDDVVANEPGDVSTADQELHGTAVWSVLGGYAPGDLVGAAYDANFLLAKVDREDTETSADEDRWVAAAEWAQANGADIVSSSLVYRFDFADRPDIPYQDLNGDITVTTRAADVLASRGVLVVNAIGNDGPDAGTLNAPADADSIIAVGMTRANGSIVPASSRGPTFDGRIKPELVARGEFVTGADPRTISSYRQITGTSMATPFISGGAAMFMQAWPSLTAMAVRRALLLSANRRTSPDNTYGSGMPDVAGAILFPEGITASSISPVDAEGRATSIAPSFNWIAPLVHPQMRPVLYRVDVATDTAFANVVYSDTIRESFSLSARRPIRPAPALYWRVTAESPVGVRRSTRRAGPFVMPDWVRLTRFAGPGVTFTDSERPEFTWSPLEAPAPAGPFTYTLQVLSAETGAIVQSVQSAAPPHRLANPLVPNVSYRWRIIAAARNGVADTVESAAPFVVQTSGQPPATLLHPTFPNPFPRLGRSEARIWFDLAQGGAVELAVYDLRGRLVRQLIPAEPGCGVVELEPGVYGRGAGALGFNAECAMTSWDGRDASGALVQRGVYLLRLRTGGRALTQRILFQP